MTPMQLLVQRVSSGLKRNSITNASQYATMYRVMGEPFPGKWSFKYHPWTREIHDSKKPVVAVEKGAQLAITETALNKVFHAIDIRGLSVLYILPASKPDAADFSKSRFDPALELSEHLAKLFSETNNIGHKRAGNSNLFIRGSKSRSQLKSLPAAVLIFDEVDEMVQKNITLAFERASGQRQKEALLISTPTIPHYGIDHWYQKSTQKIYYFKCPSCSRYVDFSYPESLIITAEDIHDPNLKNSFLICKLCKAKINQEDKPKILSTDNAQWVASYEDRDVEGYNINQCYSSTVSPFELGKYVLEARNDETIEMEMNNSKFGKTYLPKGGKVSPDDIEQCIGPYDSFDSLPKGTIVTLGADPGKVNHYAIVQWFLESQSIDINLCAIGKLIKEGFTHHFEEIDTLMRQYNVTYAIIDAQPERRKSIEICQRWWGKMKRCYYANGISARQVRIHSEEDQSISVDRTSWMELALLSRFRTRRIRIPRNVSNDFKEHIKEPTRVTKKDKTGNYMSQFISVKDDHLAHALTYAEIALPFACNLVQNENLAGVM